MTTNEQAEIKKSKAPKIVTWLAVIVALMVALMKSGVSGDGSWSAFTASFFVHFLVVYFALWIVTKVVRKTTGEEKKTALTVSSISAAVVLLFIFTAMYVPTEADSETGLHACTSDSAVAAIKSTLEKSAASNEVQIELLDVSDLQEVSISDDGKARECIGQVVLNTGRTFIKYTFSFAESDSSQVLIEIKELDLANYSYLRGQAQQNAKESGFKAQMDAHDASGQ